MPTSEEMKAVLPALTELDLRQMKAFYAGAGDKRVVAAIDELIEWRTNANEGVAMLCAQFDDLAAAMGWTQEKDMSQLEYARTLGARPPLDKLTPDLIEILGRPCFRCADIAELMRHTGSEIPRRAENEQAAVLHWLLGLYLTHGESWKSAANAELVARGESIKAKQDKKDHE